MFLGYSGVLEKLLKIFTFLLFNNINQNLLYFNRIVHSMSKANRIKIILFGLNKLKYLIKNLIIKNGSISD